MYEYYSLFLTELLHVIVHTIILFSLKWMADLVLYNSHLKSILPVGNRICNNNGKIIPSRATINIYP